MFASFNTGKDISSGFSVTNSLLNTIDIFLDTLINLDPLLVSRDVQLTVEELVRANEIKDYVRETSITALMNSCYHLVVSLGAIRIYHFVRRIQLSPVFADAVRGRFYQNSLRELNISVS